MTKELIHTLDAETLAVFAAKGTQGPAYIKQQGLANSVKVRRVMQVTRDLAQRPLDALRILDLACGEGVYSIEAALRGAAVVAIDARTERMGEGVKAAQRLGLERLEFEQGDIRQVTVDSHGQFDIIYFLGILYHLDAADVAPVLCNIYKMCRQFVIIDTHIALSANRDVEFDGKTYGGKQRREHADAADDCQRRASQLSSIDNTFSFWFTAESLYRLLGNVGFTSVATVNAPLEPGKPENRITLVALKGTPVKLSSYPWVNDMSEAEIEGYLAEDAANRRCAEVQPGWGAQVRRALNFALRPLGMEVHRAANKRN